ncbi:peptidoglycan-binding domain-containing protein [Lentibacillus sp. JNUCC-1]|uniref:peptidoglycan-binding domain-containing protein n=1 Tax=Lentibacillus sp. JNUCC-1 TaxID=2654513 RepID=UPI002F906F56
MLEGLGYDTDRKDGYFSKATEKAVKAFQKDNSLQVTGEIDSETAGQLQQMVVEKVRNGEDDQQMEKALNALYES